MLRWRWRRATIVLLLGFCASAVSGAQTLGPDGQAGTTPLGEVLDPALFPVPESLLPAVRFWLAVFVEHESTKVVLHDDRHLEVVYGVLDMADLDLSGMSDGSKAKERRKRIKRETERLQKVLRRLGGDRRFEVDQAELNEVARLFQGIPGDSSRFASAAGRVRSQTGLRDRFEEAIEISGMFMPGIQRILAAHGVPGEVASMPFVESMFNYKARSKVGASGAWQFTRSTGRLFLQIDSAVDARSDVLLAAEGAARLLLKDYESLRSWPLTLTGYNHGSSGMRRAIKKLGTRDIGVIVADYRSRTFGFASRNFYAEFVAAASAYRDREIHFPDARPLPELLFDEFALGRYVSLLDLAQLTGVAESELVALNPALNREVFAGTLLVPPGYRLRVPEGSKASFVRAFDELPAMRKRDRQLAVQYRVVRGDTLGGIARRYRTSIGSLQRANNLPRADRIYPGQVLEIPSQGGSSGWQARVDLAALMGAGDAVADAVAGEQTHRVRSGENLTAIAQSYGVTVQTLMAVNELVSADLLRVGQNLRIPSGGSAVHVVRSGDSLARIAKVYGTTIERIVRSNSLRSTVIHPGQVLQIPRS